jgi:organic hydroperoxide reductase OsmC/OhrA
MESSIDFSVSSSSPAGIKTLWEANYADTSRRAPLKMAIPHCFGGPGNEASPEDLYLLSLLNCLIATFKVFAEKSKLGYERLDGFANLNLIQEPSGVSSFKNINIKLELFSPENRVKAERLFNKVESQSMIVNSVKTKVDINWIIKG